MKNANYYKVLFIIGAIWNLAAGIMCWMGSMLIPETFFPLFNMPSPTSLFPFHTMFWLIIAFGIGYIIVSRDISKNHGLILIGILGKTIFFIDCVVTILLKEANIMLLGPGTIRNSGVCYIGTGQDRSPGIIDS